MLRIDSVRSFVRSLFVREVVVEVPVVQRVEVPVDRVVVKPVDRVVEVEKTVEVEPMREYWILHSHKPMVISTGVVRGATEFACLPQITAFAGERIQFANGGRYRVHSDMVNGTRNAFTRIDRADRRGTGHRAAHRARTREQSGVIVGE